MMNSKKSLLLLVLFLLATSVTAVAVQKTEFVVKTNPDNQLNVLVLDPDASNQEIGSFKGIAKKSGEYRFTYHGIVDKVKLNIKIVNNATGEIIDEKEFGPYTLGTTIVNVNFSSSKVEEEPVLEQTTELTETEISESEITGLAIDEESSSLSSIYYYVIGGVIALVILLVIMKKRVSTVQSGPTEPNPKKIMKAKTVPSKTEMQVKTIDKSNDSSISETEKRISDLQKQLEQIRSEEKLAKLQKQINLEKQSLKRLQDETNDKPQVQQNQNNNLDNKPF